MLRRAVFLFSNMPDLAKYIPNHVSVRRLQTFGIFLLCATTVWFRSGVYPPLQWPMLVFATLLCMGMLFLKPAERGKLLGRIRRDPVFLAGIVFLVLVLSQSLNSGYLVLIDEEGFIGMSTHPPRWLPWSVDAGEAREMLVWFFPSLVCVLLVRNVLEWPHIKLLLHLFVWNAGALALAGILQHVANARSMLGIWAIPGGVFFATFDYVNHAAEWFCLNAFLSLALLKDGFRKGKPAMQACVWCLVLLLCIVAALLTLSRFGALVALSLLFISVAVLTKRVLRRVSGAATANAVVAGVIVALLGIVLFYEAGDGSLAKEVHEKALFGEVSVSDDIGERIAQMPVAWAIVRDYPLFGSGGWGYRWLARLYIPSEDEAMWNIAGKSNVHCDPLQFLSEFGFIGASLLAGMVVLLVIPAVKGWRPSALGVWIGLGVSVTAFHGLFDLPFRCPAILLQWLVLLAALPWFCSRQGDQPIESEPRGSGRCRNPK